MSAKISVIFINYNTTVYLDKAISTFKQTEPEQDLEVIVVDNASQDYNRVQMICQNHGARLLRLSQNLGYGAAANRGARYAQGKYLAVANPDIEFLPGAVTRLLSFLEDNPDVGVVSPQLIYPDGTPQPSCRRLPKLRYLFAGRRSPLLRFFPGYPLAKEFLYLGIDQAKEPVEVESVIGAFMLFRREAFETVGGFDERFFMFAEDLDICLRLHQKKWRVFLEPRARICHYYGGVRRKRRRFSEFHRIKSLYLFFIQRKPLILRGLFTVLFAGYLFLLEALGMVGLGEFEYSWQSSNRRKSG
ncbi:MAG: glycosyltransferase family 2 protein [candidate division WOR-3 bacterium]